MKRANSQRNEIEKPFNPAKGIHILSTTDGTIYTTDISDGPGTECLGIKKNFNGGYLKLGKLGYPINKEKQSMHPYIAPDESYIILTSWRPSEKTNSVLFISYKKSDGSWTEP